MQLFPVDDFITLEYDDRVELTFTPSSEILFPGLENLGEYVRHTTVVNIIDNDSKGLNLLKIH